MDGTSLVTGAVGMIALGAGFFAQAVVSPSDAPNLFGIPLASFASSGATVVAMALALRYMADRQIKNEDALREAYRGHIDALTRLLADANLQNKQELEILQKLSHTTKPTKDAP